MLVGTGKNLNTRSGRLLLKHVLRKIFLEDWVMKLIALAITLGLWLGVTVFTKQGSGRFTVPLIIRPSDNAILTGSGVKDVTIRVKGDDQKIRELSPADIHILLDLESVEPGEKIITIDPQSVSNNLPSGVRLEDIQPRGIPVKLENAEQKDVVVRANIQGDPAKGFEIYPNEMIKPQRITIRGPASYIRTLDYLTTDKIDVTGKSEDFTAIQVPIRPANENVTVSDTVVDVDVHIGERRIERSLLVPVAGSPGKKATVVLYGPPALIDGIRPESLKAEMIKNDTGQDVPRVILPDSLIANIEIRKVKVN